MSDIKPSDHGIVVEHKESGMRFAVSDRNYNPKVHRKVRDLKPGESVRTYSPRHSERVSAASSPEGGTSTPEAGDKSESEGSEALRRTAGSTKTEGSASAGTQG